MELIERPPTLAELAVAGPVVAATRAAGVPDAAMLELTWVAPALAAAVPGAIALERPAAPPLPFADAAAGAVVLVDPPRAARPRSLEEATRVATHAVVAVAGLDAFEGRSARPSSRRPAGPGTRRPDRAI